MDEAFFDRYGRKKYATDIIPIRQKGYFAILVKDKKVLLTYPPLVDIPEFPGGSIARGENFRECLFRKLYEETGIEFMLSEGEKEFTHTLRYFAEDARPYGEYCIYDMTFLVYDAASYGFDTSVAKCKTPENGCAVWLPIAEILSGETKINYAHWLAFKELFNEQTDISTKRGI